MRLLLAADCPRCRVSRETRLCGWRPTALRAFLVVRPRLLSCQVCGFDGVPAWPGGVAGPVGSPDWPRAAVERRACELLLARGIRSDVIDRMRLVAD